MEGASLAIFVFQDGVTIRKAEEFLIKPPHIKCMDDLIDAVNLRFHLPSSTLRHLYHSEGYKVHELSDLNHLEYYVATERHAKRATYFDQRPIYPGNSPATMAVSMGDARYAQSPPRPQSAQRRSPFRVRPQSASNVVRSPLRPRSGGSRPYSAGRGRPSSPTYSREPERVSSPAREVRVEPPSPPGSPPGGGFDRPRTRRGTQSVSPGPEPLTIFVFRNGDVLRPPIRVAVDAGVMSYEDLRDHLSETLLLETGNVTDVYNMRGGPVLSIDAFREGEHYIAASPGGVMLVDYKLPDRGGGEVLRLERDYEHHAFPRDLTPRPVKIIPRMGSDPVAVKEIFARAGMKQPRY